MQLKIFLGNISLGEFLCIPTPNTGQLNPPFHTFAEFRLTVNRIVVGQCMVPKYHAAVDYTPRLRAPRNLPRCMANSDTCKGVANNYPGSATANSYLGTTST